MITTMFCENSHLLRITIFYSKSMIELTIRFIIEHNFNAIWRKIQESQARFRDFTCTTIKLVT
ncbi:hypothetical protein CGH72_22350 [Vibrio parahaemolyticus]|nr:hypothetical protein CGH75_22740 [Vibrio parahaemolyticus]TOM65334.1 hypothetical protein CGH73_19885 [Vibrio parahaemolyticus]TOM66493.1 hypothetical protein CGH72_22350 [Vibrio parahaemolyticus]TOO79426.1 hypothetical protein CGH29_24270 [Vibrio parahaemolyticus]